MPLVCLCVCCIAWVLCQSSCILISYLVAGVKNIHVFHVSSVHTYIKNATLKLHLRVFCSLWYVYIQWWQSIFTCLLLHIMLENHVRYFCRYRQGTRCEEHYIYTCTQLAFHDYVIIPHNVYSTVIVRGIVFAATKTCMMKIGGAKLTGLLKHKYVCEYMYVCKDI